MNSALRYQLFLFYPIHLGSIVGLFFVNYSTLNLLFFFIGWILLHGYGAELGLHRYAAHKTFNIKPIFIKPLMFFSTLSIQGSILGWACVHRQHHIHSEKLADPHSPNKGYWYAWHGWINNWQEYTAKKSFKYVKDLIRNKDVMFFTKNTALIIVVTYLIIGLISIDLLFWGLMLPATFSLIQSYNVNLFCHLKKFGYRNFETKDDSTNIQLLSFLSWGLSLHNNHHAKPGSCNLEFKDNEFDAAARLLLPVIKK